MEETPDQVRAAWAKEEVRGSSFLLFLFLLPGVDKEEACLEVIWVLRTRNLARCSTVQAGFPSIRNPWASAMSITYSSSCPKSSSFSVPSSSSSFLLASSAWAVRKEMAEESTTSPNAPASMGRPRVGRACRRLRSLLCGRGSTRMPGRSPGGGVLFCARGPWCVACSTSSLVLAIFWWLLSAMTTARDIRSWRSQ